MIDWTHWHNEPYLVGGLILLGWLYALATGPFRARLAPAGTPYPAGKAACFYAALVIFYLAVGSPLDQAGERFLLTAHMVQHMLLIYPAAILLLAGLPAWLVSQVSGRAALRRPLAVLFHPAVCALTYTATISIWHLPALYDWALRDKFIHVIEHITFFVAALLYWWPLLSPSREYPPAKYALQMLYLLAVTLMMTPLFAYLAFSSEILYPTYEYAPRLIPGFDAAQDQLLGAATMKLGGMFMSFLALIWAFYHWYQAIERTPSHSAVPGTK
jgi:putative membrane protein